MPDATFTRSQIVAAARTLLGVPWIHQGRRPDIGIDCIGLLACTGKVLGVDFEDRVDYSFRPDGVTLLKRMREQFTEKPIDQILPGDIVIFWISKKSLPQHVGIWTSNDSFQQDEVVEGGVGVLHTFSSWGKVVESAIDRRWRRRISAVFEFPGVTE